jgi:hypothetical protein
MIGSSVETVGGARLARPDSVRLLGVTAFGGSQPMGDIHFRSGQFGGLRQLHGVAVERDPDSRSSFITHIWHFCDPVESGSIVAHGRPAAMCCNARYTVDASGAFLQGMTDDEPGRTAARALQRFYQLLHAPMYQPESSAAALADMRDMAAAQHAFEAHQILAASAKALLGR